MNLLPGLRELRAPLASGYLWLVAVWVGLGHAGWLPDKRPPGNGEVARLWDLGGTLGKTIVLAAVTFIAYLIGSFLQMDPDGRTARFLAPLVLFDRRPNYFEGVGLYERVSDEVLYLVPMPKAVEERLLDSTGFGQAAQRARAATEALQRAEMALYSEYQAKISEWYLVRARAETVAQLLSRDARLDLMDLLSQRHALPSPPASDGSPRLNLTSVPSWRLDLSYLGPDRSPRIKSNYRWGSDRKFVYDVEPLKAAIIGDEIISAIIKEVPQLASRLVVKSQDLYSKYDRHMAEAAVRMNVSIPLTALLILVTWLSDLPTWSRVVSTAFVTALGFMLLRQGFLCTVAARDVIAQALTIDEIQSRHIPVKESVASPTEEMAGAIEPGVPIRDVERIQRGGTPPTESGKRA